MLSLIHMVSGRPWAIRGELAFHVRGLVTQEGMRGLRHLVELKSTAHAYFDPDDAAEKRAARRGRASEPVGTVAVIPVIGLLTQRGSVINSAETRSTTAVAEEVRAAIADPKVDAVVLEFDTPGGEVFGVAEAWAAIREAGKLKPVVAAVNSIAASAGYWLACACQEIVLTPSGEAGSIGVYALHVDASKSLEDAGEKWTFVHAGKYKVEGNSAEPLTEEARANIQGSVDRYYQMFTENVAKGRGVSIKKVQGGFGEGRVLGAAAALEERMVDSVGTLEQAIRRAAELGRDRRDGRTSSRAEGQLPAPVARREAWELCKLAHAHSPRACAAAAELVAREKS